MDIQKRIDISSFKREPKIYLNKKTNKYNYIEDSVISYRGKYKKGVKLKNKDNDEYIIKGVCGCKNDGRKVFIAEFIDTKFQIHITGNQINSGNIKDFFKPSVCGVGYLGYGDFYKSSDYSHWRSLIKRVYDKTHKSYINYKDAKICDRWLCFENFQNDLPRIKGFDRGKFENDEIVLDKDIGCYNLDYDIYKIDTCQYISRILNDKIQLKHQRFMEFKYHKGDINITFIHYNKTYLLDKLNLRPNGINRALDELDKNYKGWSISTFTPKDIWLKYIKDMDTKVESIAEKYGKW